MKTITEKEYIDILRKQLEKYERKSMKDLN